MDFACGAPGEVELATGLSWHGWGGASPFATGTFTTTFCAPQCPGNKLTEATTVHLSGMSGSAPRYYSSVTSVSADTEWDADQLTVPAAAYVDRIPNGGFATARALWRQSYNVDDAEVGSYWLVAAEDLSHGLATDAKASSPGGRASYERAIANLRTITATPDTDASQEQQAVADLASRALDRFFDTPGLYS